MSSKRLSDWCQSILPDNYRQVKHQTLRYQQFLLEQLPDSISHTVQVINLSKEAIIITTNNAQITHYLRLHTRELQQQFNETFATRKKLIFKTMPADLLQIERRQTIKKPRRVCHETIASIRRNAQWIEDKALKKALESLASQLSMVD